MVGLEDSPDELPDLVAEILAHAVEQRQRRQLSRGYIAREAVRTVFGGGSTCSKPSVISCWRVAWWPANSTTFRSTRLEIASFAPPSNRSAELSVDPTSRIAAGLWRPG